MPNPRTPKMVNASYPQLKSARTLEDILCLATLTATNTLPYNATTADATERYEKFPNGCDDCCFVKVCLACAINE